MCCICRCGRNKQPKCPQTALEIKSNGVVQCNNYYLFFDSTQPFPVVQGRCSIKSESRCKTRISCCIPQPLSHLRRKNSKEFGVWRRKLKQCCDHTWGSALCNSSGLKNLVQNILRVMFLSSCTCTAHPITVSGRQVTASFSII